MSSTIITGNRFGVALKTERLEAGLSQRDLAQLVGIDHTYLSKIENGKVDPPSTDVIVSLCFELASDRVNEILMLSGKIDKDLVRAAVARDESIGKLIMILCYGYPDKATVRAMLALAEKRGEGE